MSDEDGLRIEAAMQFGFTEIDGTEVTAYSCTEAELIAFAKACERKGLAVSRKFARQEFNNPLSARDKSALTAIIGRISTQIATIDAELAPILAAESDQ